MGRASRYMSRESPQLLGVPGHGSIRRSLKLQEKGALGDLGICFYSSLGPELMVSFTNGLYVVTQTLSHTRSQLQLPTRTQIAHSHFTPPFPPLWKLSPAGLISGISQKVRHDTWLHPCPRGGDHVRRGGSSATHSQFQSLHRPCLPRYHLPVQRAHWPRLRLGVLFPPPGKRSPASLVRRRWVVPVALAR